MALRQRLVRQSNLSSSGNTDFLQDSNSSSDAGTFRQLSSESLDNLTDLSPRNRGEISGKRRHSIACGTIFVEVQKSAVKSVFNTAVRRVSDACSFLPSVSSSQPTMASNMESVTKSDEKVLLPNVLGTFSRGMDQRAECVIDVNRRFSSDFPPPTYQEATKLRNKFCTAAETEAFKQVLFKHENSDSFDDSQDSIESLPE